MIVRDKTSYESPRGLTLERHDYHNGGSHTALISSVLEDREYKELMLERCFDWPRIPLNRAVDPIQILAL